MTMTRQDNDVPHYISFTLDQDTINTIQQHADKHFDGNKSMALRNIIRQFKEENKPRK